MDELWSTSTTMRNPERMLSFLKTAAELEGEIWDDATQIKYQALLIKNRFYAPTRKNLSDELFALLEDYEHELTYEEALKIFTSKGYEDPPMRGRTSFNPLTKLGLAVLHEQRVVITEFGKMFLEGNIDLGEVALTGLLKTQYPYPLSNGYRDYNIKPFIGALRLIRRVNELCAEAGEHAHGVSREEFGIFVLSQKQYNRIDSTARNLLEFRREKKKRRTEDERAEYVSAFIKSYLSNYKNPEKNHKEYSDNIIRYLRLTKFIYSRRRILC